MLPCRHDTGGLKCLGHCFSTAEAALKISVLEGNGFDVFAPWFHAISNMPHSAVALGGIPILVPHGQSGDAMTLLLAIEEANDSAAKEEGAAPKPLSMPRNLTLRWLTAILMFFIGTAPGLNETFLNIEPSDP